MVLGAGTTINNRYEVIKELGEGGFGWVYQARDLELGRIVALKMLKVDYNYSAKDLERFQREARFLAQVVHPNIVTVYAFGLSESNQAFIVMEYLEGQSLATYFNTNGKLDPFQAIAIFTQIVRGLAHAHSLNMVHRDLSPANVFLIEEPPSVVVKLIDFGLSKVMEDAGDRLTHTGFLVGNPKYMSPEIARGQQADHRSDIYSLGCMMYETISGAPPFFADSPMGYLYLHQNEYPSEPQFSMENKLKEHELKQIILQCMQKDPEDRFQSCDDLIRCLSSEEPEKPLASSSGVSTRTLHSWAGSSRQAPAPAHMKPIIAARILISCLVLIGIFYQAALLDLMLNVLVQSKSHILEKREGELAQWLLNQNKINRAELLFEDLVTRAKIDHDSATQASDSLLLAECYLREGKLSKGCALIEELLQESAKQQSSASLKKFYKEVSRLLDKFTSSGTVTEPELFLRAHMLIQLNTNRLFGVDERKAIMVRLLGRTFDFRNKLSPVESLRWYISYSSPIQHTISDAVAGLVSEPKFLVTAELPMLVSFMDKDPRILNAFIANPSTPAQTKRTYRLNLLEFCHLDSPQQRINKLKQLYKDEEGIPLFQVQVLCILAQAYVAIGDFNEAFRTVAASKSLEKQCDPSIILRAEQNETEVLDSMHRQQEAQDKCRDLLARLNGVRKTSNPTDVELAYNRLIPAMIDCGLEAEAIKEWENLIEYEIEEQISYGERASTKLLPYLEGKVKESLLGPVRKAEHGR